jgi:hypothetical protein
MIRVVLLITVPCLFLFVVFNSLYNTTIKIKKKKLIRVCLERMLHQYATLFFRPIYFYVLKVFLKKFIFFISNYFL